MEQLPKSAPGMMSSALLQYRQLSIPLWTRILVVVLVSLVFLGNASFLIFALVKQQEKWIQASVSIFGTTFLPTIVILYVAFAETGTKALGRKTLDLLTKIIPECLEKIQVTEFPVERTCQDSPWVQVHVREVRGTTCKYVVNLVMRHSDQPEKVIEQLHFSVDINVNKVNILLMIRNDLLDPADDLISLETIQKRLPHTIEGALLEEYKLNPHLKPVQVDRIPCAGLTATKRLPPDFLWDPSQKLYFAQDLALFIGSALAEGQTLFQPEK